MKGGLLKIIFFYGMQFFGLSLLSLFLIIFGNIISQLVNYELRNKIINRYPNFSLQFIWVIVRFHISLADPWVQSNGTKQSQYAAPVNDSSKAASSKAAQPQQLTQILPLCSNCIIPTTLVPSQLHSDVLNVSRLTDIQPYLFNRPFSSDCAGLA